MITVRKPMPVIITTVPTSRPSVLVGTRSPYPTVVTVCTAHHRPWPMSEKFLWSAKRITVPPSSVMATVASPMMRAARPAVSGLRSMNFQARGCTGGAGWGLI